MWTALLIVYVAGLAVTALAVFRNRVLREGYLINAASVVLWPVYWSLFLASVLLNRTPGGPKPPAQQVSKRPL